MEKKLNTPFVALLAGIVGMVIAGFVVAVDPLPGPPLKEVSTYTVIAQGQFVNPFPGLVYPSPASASAQCSAGDKVTGGGFEVLNWEGFVVHNRLHIINSHSYANLSNGAEGWKVTLAVLVGIGYLLYVTTPPPEPRPDIRLANLQVAAPGCAPSSSG